MKDIVEAYEELEDLPEDHSVSQYEDHEDSVLQFAYDIHAPARKLVDLLDGMRSAVADTYTKADGDSNDDEIASLQAARDLLEQVVTIIDPPRLGEVLVGIDPAGDGVVFMQDGVITGRAPHMAPRQIIEQYGRAFSTNKHSDVL